MLRAEKTVQIGNDTYKLNVLEGNHGGWLFVMEHGATIFEQSGYKDDGKALLDGEAIAIATSYRRYEEAAEQFLNGRKTHSWGQERVIPEANFAWLVENGMALSDISDRGLAREFEVATATVKRWASAQSSPMQGIMSLIVQRLKERVDQKGHERGRALGTPSDPKPV